MPLDANIIMNAGRNITQLKTPVESASKVQTLKAQMQKNQAGQMELEDEQAARQVFKQAGGDFRQAAKLATDSGLVGPALKFGALADRNDKAQQDTVAKMNETQRKIAQEQSVEVSKALMFADNPEKWDIAMGHLSQGIPQMAQYKGKFDPALRQNLINQGQTMQQVLDQVKTSNSQANLDKKALVDEAWKQKEFGLKERDTAARETNARKPSGSGLTASPDGGFSPEALDMMANQFRKTGQFPTVGMGGAAANIRIKIANRASEMDKADGITTDLAESKKTFKTSQDAREYFTRGKGADAFRQQETIIHHADAFSKIAEALNNGDIQGANKIGNALGVQFGNNSATNYKIVSQVLSAEVGKYLAGSQSTAEERKELADLIPMFSSPQQIGGGLTTLKTLVEGQRQSWTVQRDAALKGQVPTYPSEVQKAPTPTKVWTVKDDNDYKGLPPGSRYKGPDGIERVK